MNEKSKLKRLINFLKYNGKFVRSDYVVFKPILNNGKESKQKYIKYANQKGIVTNVDFTQNDYIVGVKFDDGFEFNCKIEELEKLDYKYEYSEHYTKLLKMISGREFISKSRIEKKIKEIENEINKEEEETSGRCITFDKYETIKILKELLTDNI